MKRILFSLCLLLMASGCAMRGLDYAQAQSADQRFEFNPGAKDKAAAAPKPDAPAVAANPVPVVVETGWADFVQKWSTNGLLFAILSVFGLQAWAGRGNAIVSGHAGSAGLGGGLASIAGSLFNDEMRAKADQFLINAIASGKPDDILRAVASGVAPGVGGAVVGAATPIIHNAAIAFLQGRLTHNLGTATPAAAVDVASQFGSTTAPAADPLAGLIDKLGQDGLARLASLVANMKPPSAP